jgi:stage II sporulation protein D
MVEPVSGRAIRKGSAHDQWIVRRPAAEFGGISVKREGESIEQYSPSAAFTIDSGGYFLFEGREYSGTFIVYLAGEGLQLVNAVDTESYLRGVLPAEMGRQDASRFESLKAQAVASRGYALYRASLNRDPHYDLVASHLDQVYSGAGRCDSLSIAAIDETRGLVLSHADTLIVSYFHSTCGGHTEDIRDAWGERHAAAPYYCGVGDRLTHMDGTWRDLCDISPHYRWERRNTPSEIEHAFAGYLEETEDGVYSGMRGDSGIRRSRSLNIGRLADIRITEKTGSGRIGELLLVFDGDTFLLTGDRIRWALRSPEKGGTILKSTFFSVELVKNDFEELVEVIFRGRGFGHGVGLCQWGAFRMAELGFTFEEILYHYYPDTEIVKLY